MSRSRGIVAPPPEFLFVRCAPCSSRRRIGRAVSICRTCDLALCDKSSRRVRVPAVDATRSRGGGAVTEREHCEAVAAAFWTTPGAPLARLIARERAAARAEVLEEAAVYFSGDNLLDLDIDCIAERIRTLKERP